MIGNPSEDLNESQQETDLLYENMLKVSETEITKYIGSEITKKNFLTALSSGYDIIHYAGHAEFDKKEPDRSFLKFKDGFCYAYEIRQFITDNPPKLAFINACSSARETHESMSKYETNIPSLARVFLYAGVNAYIGSMWSVHDSSAAAFAIWFYKYLIDGYTIGDAMRRARINIYKKGTKNDVGWSPFILYGDPETRLVA
jgi:CHAT domain-containing protein